MSTSSGQPLFRMAISYDVTIDDIVAFNRYHYAHSATMRKFRFLFVVLLTLILLIGAIHCFQAQRDKVTGAIAALVFLAFVTPFFAGIYYLAFRKNTEWSVRRLLAEGENKGLIGFHELVIDDERITESNDFGGANRLWTAVNRIEETEDYAFIYIGSISAHVIPKQNVASGDPANFIEHARDLLAAAKG